jgi:DNA polymerase V
VQIASSAEDYVGEVSSPAATFLVETDTGTFMVDFSIPPVDTLVMDRSRGPKHDVIIMVPWSGHCMVKRPHRRSRQL